MSKHVQSRKSPETISHNRPFRQKGPAVKDSAMRIWTMLPLLLLLAATAAAQDGPVRLTPPPGPAAKINGPAVYGCRAGHPFLYRIPATGVRPMTFAAEGLPAGLTLDAQSGIIRGAIAGRGEYGVTL